MNRRSFSIAASLTLSGVSAAKGEPELLPPEQAFKMALGTVASGSVEVKFRSATGYYLYADRFLFESDNVAVKVVGVVLPAGQNKFDEAFGRDVSYYRGDMSVSVKVLGPAIPFGLAVHAQGCADAGVCYPPITRTFNVAGRNS
jgi:thiol:disulfide interchange protein DsbD